MDQAQLVPEDGEHTQMTTAESVYLDEINSCDSAVSESKEKAVTTHLIMILVCGIRESSLQLLVL